MKIPTTSGESTERPASLWKEILNLLDRSPAELLPFEEVRTRLKLRPGLFRGLRQIPLDRIIGSVGRYHDFDRAFLPHRADDRWLLINAAWHRGEQLPPIEVYQVGDVYFVCDGNHRVSVARANGASDIDAYVTEFHSPVPIEPDTDLDDLIVKQEQAEFLERTRLPALRTEARIELAVPDGYRQLLEHIAVHRYFLGQEHGQAVPWEEAVTHWYDQVYLPIVRAIRRHKLMAQFPNRTEGDLYLWISRHQWELRERYSTYTVDADLAAADFAAHHASEPLGKARQFVQNALTSIGNVVQQLVPPSTVLPIVVPTRIARINALPATWRRRIYRLTLPNALLAAHGIDPITLTVAQNQLAVQFDDQPGSQVAAITATVPGCDDPLFSLGLADDPEGRLHLTHLFSYRPDAPRYNIDRTETGAPLRAGERNRVAEVAAFAAGLAPEQVRAPTDALPTVLAQVEVLAAAMDHPLFVARACFYHEALFLERQGLAYSWSETWMCELDQRFRSGDLAARLDGSTPFRQPAAATSIRGRSWAIYDGILDQPWPDVWMYKLVGRHTGVDTFPGGVW
jgi:hypothetical protein